MVGTKPLRGGQSRVEELASENRALREKVARLSAALEQERGGNAKTVSEPNMHRTQKFELIAKLVNGIAHDFNNVLAVVSANAAMVVDDIGDHDDHRECVENILLAGERGSMLVQKLMSFARPKPVKPRVVEVNRAVDSVERFLRLLAGSCMHIETSFDDDAGAVMVDANQLEQVLMNLVVNARDACGGRGTITVQTDSIAVHEPTRRGGVLIHRGAYSIIRVSDNGPGIPTRVLPHIFEPFFSTKEPGEGTGLGLATVHAIVEQSQGEVGVATSPEGTTFEIFFPRVDHSTGDRGSTQVATRKTVLLVEDDDVLREALNSVLERRGLSVVSASTGEQAIELLEREGESFDMLLADVMLPGVLGTEVARRYLALYPHRPALMMTGYAPEAAGWPADLDGLEVLTKPVMPARLVQAIRERLAQKVA